MSAPMVEYMYLDSLADTARFCSFPFTRDGEDIPRLLVVISVPAYLRPLQRDTSLRFTFLLRTTWRQVPTAERLAFRTLQSDFPARRIRVGIYPSRQHLADTQRFLPLHGREPYHCGMIVLSLPS